MKKIFWLIVLITICSCSNYIKKSVSITVRENDTVKAQIIIDKNRLYEGFGYVPAYKNFLSAHMINDSANFLKFSYKDHWCFSSMGLNRYHGYIYYGTNTKNYKAYNDMMLDSFKLSTKRDLIVGGAIYCNNIYLINRIKTDSTIINSINNQQIKFSDTAIEINKNNNIFKINNDSTTFNKKIVGTDITATGTIDASAQPIKLKTYKQDSEPDIPNNTTAIWVYTIKLPYVIYLLVDIDGIQVKGKLTE